MDNKVVNFNAKEAKAKLAATGATGATGASEPVSIEPVGQTSGTAAVATQSNKPASSGMFINVQKYLAANKGAGAQIAGSIGNTFQKELQPGKSLQESEANKFKAGAKAAGDLLKNGVGYQAELDQATTYKPTAADATGMPTFQKTAQPVAVNTPAPTVSTIGPSTQVEADKSPAFTKEQIEANATPGIAQPKSFNPTSFTDDTNKLLEFTKLRTGKAFDQSLLNKASAASALQANLNRSQTEELLNRANTNTGRAGLISQTFNAPSYSQGQQRLDNLFLAGAGRKGVGAVQDLAKQNLAKAQGVVSDAKLDTKQAEAISNKDLDLRKTLQARASALESGFITDLGANVGAVNQARDAEQARYKRNIANLLHTKDDKGVAANGEIAQDIWNDIGLKDNERTYNILNDPNLTPEQIARFSSQKANTYKDVATQRDVDYYNKLAQLSSGSIDDSGKFVAPSEQLGQLKLTKAGNLDTAVEAIKGSAGLRGRIDQAQLDFIKDSLSRNVAGQGSDSGSSSIFGGGSSANSTANANFADYLATGGAAGTFAPDAQRIGESTGNRVDKQGLLTGILSNPATAALIGNNPVGWALLATQALAPGLIAGVGDTTASLAGTGSGSQSAANFRAKNDLLDALRIQQAKSGYNQYVSRTKGAVNADDLAVRDTAAAQDWLDMSTRGRYANIIQNDGSRMSNEYNEKRSGPTASAEATKRELLARLGGGQLADAPFKAKEREDIKAEQALLDADAASRGASIKTGSSLGPKVQLNSAGKVIHQETIAERNTREKREAARAEEERKEYNNNNNNNGGG